MTPRLSVVLSTLGNHAVLRRVLDGYDRQTARGTFEVLVVADRNEPDPGAVTMAIGTRGYPVRQLSGAVGGLSANRNVGWRAADAPVVLFTDNDTIPVPRLVELHLRAHDRQPEPEAAVAGHVRWAPQIPVTPFMRWLDRGVQFDFRHAHGEEGHWAMLYGANGSIKRAFLETVGGYDEERLPYLYEDLDWAYRASAHGLRVRYEPAAIVDHWRPMTVATWQARAPMLAAAEWQFCAKHPAVEPWFHRMFASAMTDTASTRGADLVRVIGPDVPWLGPRVWARAGLRWRRAIAPAFLAAWERAAAGELSAQPDVAVLLAERSAGS